MPPVAAGRPRSEAAREAILGSAFGLMAERGYDAMSIEAVASAAGTAKTTIYRWWPGKADLAVEAFFAATADDLAMPDTASAREDFADQVARLARLLAGPNGAVMAAMLGGARNDPVLARALGERWLAPRRAWGEARMARALREGACRPGVEAGAALGLLYGPLYAPLLFGGRVPDAPQVRAHLALALPAIFA